MLTTASAIDLCSDDLRAMTHTHRNLSLLLDALPITLLNFSVRFNASKANTCGLGRMLCLTFPTAKHLDFGKHFRNHIFAGISAILNLSTFPSNVSYTSEISGFVKF